MSTRTERSDKLARLHRSCQLPSHQSTSQAPPQTRVPCCLPCSKSRWHARSSGYKVAVKQRLEISELFLFPIGLNYCIATTSLHTIRVEWHLSHMLEAKDYRNFRGAHLQPTQNTNNVRALSVWDAEYFPRMIDYCSQNWLRPSDLDFGKSTCGNSPHGNRYYYFCPLD
jgi:hypothetical protein